MILAGCARVNPAARAAARAARTGSVARPTGCYKVARASRRAGRTPRRFARQPNRSRGRSGARSVALLEFTRAAVAEPAFFSESFTHARRGCGHHRRQPTTAGTDMDAMFWLLIAMWFAFNLLVTIKVWRGKGAARRARTAMILLVWLVPVIGAIVAMILSDWPWQQLLGVRVVPAGRGRRGFGTAGASGAAAIWLNIQIATGHNGRSGGDSSYSGDTGGGFHGGDGGGSCHGSDGGSGCHGGDGGGGGGDCGGGGDGGGGGSCH
jgi:hypothetical protein